MRAAVIIRGFLDWPVVLFVMVPHHGSYFFQCLFGADLLRRTAASDSYAKHERTSA